MTGEEPPPEHLPFRPSWDCVACGNPWPCAIAKETMLTEFREYPSVLAIYMSGRFTDAFEDLTASGAQAPPDLYDRFLCWIVTTPRALPEGTEEPDPDQGDATGREADSDDETDQQSHEGRHRRDRLPRQGHGRPPSDPTARSAEAGQDKPRRGGGSPPTRSDPSHGGHHRLRCVPPTRPYRHMDL